MVFCSLRNKSCSFNNSFGVVANKELGFVCTLFCKGLCAKITNVAKFATINLSAKNLLKFQNCTVTVHHACFHQTKLRQNCSLSWNYIYTSNETRLKSLSAFKMTRKIDMTDNNYISWQILANWLSCNFNVNCRQLAHDLL